jgi:hypothetical protein
VGERGLGRQLTLDQRRAGVGALYRTALAVGSPRINPSSMTENVPDLG